jgi:hypothetical protein
MEEYLKEREMPSEILFFRDGVREKIYDKLGTEIAQLMHVMNSLNKLRHKPVISHLLISFHIHYFHCPLPANFVNFSNII